MDMRKAINIIEEGMKVDENQQRPTPDFHNYIDKWREAAAQKGLKVGKSSVRNHELVAHDDEGVIHDRWTGPNGTINHDHLGAHTYPGETPVPEHGRSRFNRL